MQNPTQFTLYRNTCKNNLSFVSYPMREQIRSPDDLKNAVAFDHVFAEYKDGQNKYGQKILKHRKNENFISSNVVALDVDNSETNDPQKWITFEKFRSDFPDVEFYIATSRNHLKQKENQSPRPKFHVYFPITDIKSTAEYTKLKKITVSLFPYFDPNAVDCARVFIGNKFAEVYYYQGHQKLDSFITEKYKKLSETITKPVQVAPPLKAPKYNQVSVVCEGQRNNHMHKVACNLLYRFGESQNAWQKYHVEAEKCSPPLDFSELNTIWESAKKWYNLNVITNPNYIRPENFSGVLKNKETVQTSCEESIQQDKKSIPEKETPKTVQNIWQTPRPLYTITVPEFPYDLFPETLAEYIKAVSEFSETSPEMCGVLVLGVLGAVFQRKYEIVGTAGNKETLSIYSLAIAEPAERKSGVVKSVIKPFSVFEKKYNAQHLAEFSKNKADKKILLKKLAEADKADDTTEIIRLQLELDSFSERLPLSLMTDDATPEAIVLKMKEQGERTLVTASEGGFFKRIKGRYTPNGNDLDIYLKGDSGDRHSVDRIGRPSDILEKPAISIILTVQPKIIDSFLDDGEMSGTGMTARFLYAFCEEKAGTRKPTRSQSILEYEAIFEKYNNSILKALEKTIDKKEIKSIKLSSDAFNLACNYFYTAEKRIITGSEKAKGWNGKAFGRMLKIAGLFHSFECLEEGFAPEEKEVSDVNILRAAKITDCLSAHAEKAFSPFDKVNENAAYLLNKIKYESTKRGGAIDFSKTEILRFTHGKFKKAEELIEPLSILADLGYIGTNFLPTGGRPVEKITVNPILLNKE